MVRAGAAEDKLCEAELELKAGSPECLLETAAALFSAEPIRLAEATKAERGYNLALGRQAGGVAPQKAQPTALSGDETCAEALVSFVESAAAQIEVNRRAVLETDDPEAAHQLRVGLRRLRSALRAFRPLHDSPATRELQQYAREFGQSVGELRNADVFIESIYAPVAGGGRDSRASASCARLFSRIGREARQGAGGARASSGRGCRLYLALWPQTVQDNAKLARAGPRLRGRRARQELEEDRQAGRQTRRAFARGAPRDAQGAEGPALHVGVLRLALRRPQVERFVKDLKKLQDVFGYVNDVDREGARRHLRRALRRQPGGPARRRLRARLARRDVRATWEGVAEVWHRLDKRPRFWD